ncbi:hypothetical protein R3W88_031926 [Solanum pinnatisectum]|uniref:Yippee domain-containing protein n=1 Tax=Solanum pinnatisectum TaxID=50273 RepID=A0AAV9LR57_9SOLN|nr:hypothetical protein R3W88_031926 [Solanum pinnatisectum]
MKLHNDSLELEEKRTTRLESESKICELKDSFEKLLTYTVWIATRYLAGSMNKVLTHRRSTRKGNFGLKLYKIDDIYYYEEVVEPSQKYKEGKFILDLCKITDLYCVDCIEVLCWKYEQAVEPSQKYKEGKFVLELCKIVKDNW